MDAPERADDPVETWEYRDHLCHLYSHDSGDGETTWAGFARTKLPDAEDPDDVDVDVPGELVYGVEDGWLGFETTGDVGAVDEMDVGAVGGMDADAVDGMKAEVERLVDYVIELETSMDG